VQEVSDPSGRAGAATTSSTTSASQIRDTVLLLLATGTCTVEQAALQFGVNRRTVCRYLAREGHTFSGILESVRRDLAPGYVGDRRRSLAEVSALLGFSTPSSFSRWYRRNFGTSPAADRRPGTLGTIALRRPQDRSGRQQPSEGHLVGARDAA
jgi:AraC-like DNA-binding protein